MLIRLLLFVCFVLCGFCSHAQTTYYVRENGTGQGASWDDAAGRLQAMINKCSPGDRVYVAAGNYFSFDGDTVVDERGKGTGLRQKSFVMKAGVAVYGGFAGVDMSETPETRAMVVGSKYKWQLASASVLSGERRSEGTKDDWHFDVIQQRWIPSGYLMDNSLHVVWFATAGFNGLVSGEATEALPLSHETILDGFVIEGGAADGSSSDDVGIQDHSGYFGGGVYLAENGVLRNCVVRNNYAHTRGGGVFMNGGGLVSDCMIERNATPGGKANYNGFGGGAYVLGRGKIERSFVVNNSSRVGAGVYFAKDKRVLPYEMQMDMSIVANNSAAHEAGGVYCDRGGVLVGVTIVNNHTVSLNTLSHGLTGGLFCNEYGVVVNSVLWGNGSSSGSNQFYGKNIAEVEEGELSAVQLHYSAVQLLPKENFDKATLYQMVDIDNNIPAYQAHFKRVPDMLGVIHEGDYLSLADWDKDDCSVFLRNGVNEIGAPVLASGKQVDMPETTIDGKVVLDSRPDVGSYLVDKLVINHSMVAGKRVVFVDKYTSDCGDGSSWATPIRFLQSAIDYLDEKGGGEVWVKEGTYLPNLSGVFVSGPRSYSVTMRSRVSLYGGFPLSMPSPGMEDRNPVLYRTILSGDIAVRGNYDDNSFHLVVFDESLMASSVLDGFVLSSANGYGDEIAHGGAVVVKSSFAEIRNSVIENNKAPEGAAVWSDKPFKMTNCVVNNNEVEGLDAASLYLAPGSELMNVTVVMNKGIGVKLLSGKITNTVLWGNTGNPLGDSYDNVQVKGSPVITYSALSNLWEGNIFLSTLAEGENAPNFINPRLKVGVVSFGTYGTVLGGVAVFGPNCISALINGGTTNGAPKYDISGKTRDVATNDIGAYGNSCSSNNPKIRYVRAGGTGGGLSWVDAAGSLKQQVESLKGTGGEVWVAGGTYSPSNDDAYYCSYNGGPGVWSRFLMVEGVNVYGGFPNFGNPGMNERRPVSNDPRYKTILQAQEQSGNTNVGRVLTQMNDFVKPTTWDGFTMQHGSVRMLTAALTAAHGGGGGVKLMKDGRLVHTVVQNNRIDVVGSAVSLELKGGGVYNAGGELVNCHIRGNEVLGTVVQFKGTCNVSGGGVYMTSGSVYNCVVSHNKLSATGMPGTDGLANAFGGGMYIESGTLFNSTITRNTVTSQGEHRYSSMEDVSGVQVAVNATIVNCIVYGNTNTDEENKKQITGGGATTVSYSCVDGYPGTGNIDKDPQFVDPDNGDFRLKEMSPLINMGNTYPRGITLPATDMDDTERIKDCAIDIGAYERGAAGKIVPGSKNGRKVVYVTRYGAGGVDGSSWGNALCGEKLQGAIDYLSQTGGGDVWVGVGMDQVNQGERVADFYSPLLADSEIARSNIFAVHPGVHLIGGFRGDEATPDDRVLGRASSVVTVLNGDVNRTPENNIDDAYHVVVVFGSGMLDGFTVMNGNANHYMNPDYQNGGGGLVRKDGVLRNCYVKRCSALNKGGGVYVENGGILSGVVVTENDASLGGGIYAESGGKISASTVVKNSANTGGGIQFMFPASITGCVFWGNSAPSGKDVSGRTNLTYEFNHAGNLIQSYPMNYCAIENMKPHGDGNIKLSSKNEEGEDAPGFLDIDNADFFNFGWSLKPISSLIDRGLNTGLPYLTQVEDILRVYSLSKNDLAGNERVRTVRPSYVKAYMDVGAYESDTTIVLSPVCKDGVCRIYVTAVARGKADGSSWKNATADLQGALNHFKTEPTRGEVWVQGGYSYVPYRLFDGEGRDQRMLSFKLNSNVSLYGGFKGDAESGSGMISENSIEERLRYDRNQNGILEDFEFFYPTVFDGMINPADKKNHAYHVLYHDEATASGYAVVDGFTIINGNANGSEERLKNGGAIYANAPMKVANCIFYSNSASGLGGAVYLGSAGAKSMIMNSSFGGNTAGVGGGAVAMKNGVLVNSNVFNNDAGEMGGGVYAENSEVLNTLITKNTGKQGSGLYVSGGKVTNVVVWGNEGGLQVADVRNSNITYTAVQNGEGVTVSDVTHNIKLNSNNNEFDGPRFMAPTLGVGVRYFDGMTHWEVASYSPLIDKGSNVAYPAEYPQVVHQLRYQGSPTLYPVNRVENGRIDIGSYEYQRLGLKENVNRMYVRTWENNSIGSDGSSWERATSDLQGAIEILERSTASGVKEIWVAKGEYIPTKSKNGSENLRERSFMITSGGVKIYGGFPDDGTGLNPVMADRNIRKYMTVLNGNRMDNYHVMRIEGNNPVLLDGFIVQGGKGADENVSVGFDAFGSAVWMSNPAAVLNHCVFKDNEGAGGAVFMRGANTRVENSLFLNNTGYPIYMENGYFLNNTVVNNSQGGLARGGEVRNNIMWGNKEPEQLAVEGTPVIMNNAFSGTWKEEWSANNTQLDAENDSDKGPRFVAIGLGTMSDFELDCGSCLIDAGGRDVILTDTVDLASKSRVRGEGIDIGAYESMRGPIPAKPIYAGDTTTCQGVALVLNIDNSGFSGTDIFWTSAGETGVDVNLNKNPVTMSESLPGGEYLFEAVRVDMTTFCESKPEEVRVLIHSSPLVVLAAGKDVCAGENVELSFVPVKDATSYTLYEGSAVVTDLTLGNDKIVINRPSAGKHNYQLTAMVPKGVGECESLRSDTAGVTVREIPTLINGGRLSDVVSGDVVYHVPQSNVPGAQFTWKRDAVRDNPASAGRDSIYEVLTNSSNTESISVAYWYQVAGSGCPNPTEVQINLNIVPGIGTPTIERGYGECGVGYVVLNVIPAKGRQPSGYIVYKNGVEIGATAISVTGNEIRIPATPGVSAVYEVSARVKIDDKTYQSGKSTPVTLEAHPSVDAVSVTTSELEVCFGNNIVLDCSRAEEYKVYDGAELLGSELYKVVDNKITIYAPAVGKHSYGVVVVKRFEDGEVCVSSSTVTEISVDNTKDIQVKGNTTLNSNEMTDLQLSIAGDPTALTFVWDIVRKGPDISVTGGALSGSKIAMTLVNLGAEPQQVDFRVRYVDSGISAGCEPSILLTLTVNPLSPLHPETPGTDNQRVCRGDAIAEIVYPVGSGFSVTGLGQGVSYRVESGRLIISGVPTGFVKYVVSSGLQKAMGSVTVKPIPAFMLGKRK